MQPKMFITLISILISAGRICKTAMAAIPGIIVTLAAWLICGGFLSASARADQAVICPPGRSVAAPPFFAGTIPSGHLSAGKFLVASRQLSDPNFAETVVFLVHYDQKGAVGLTINRPTKMSLPQVFPQIKGLQQRVDVVYIGGPVAASQMLLLLRTENPPEGVQLIFRDIYLGTGLSVLQQIIDSSKPKTRFRVFAGYAGWAPGQLDQEVAKGGWHVSDADAATLFDMPPALIWPELIRRSSIQWTQR